MRITGETDTEVKFGWRSAVDAIQTELNVLRTALSQHNQLLPNFISVAGLQTRNISESFESISVSYNTFLLEYT